MAPQSALNVVVVDDVVRFALHVWRYLGRNIGFGTGVVKAGAKSYFYQGGEPSGLPTADGRAKVWWLPADRRWQPGLEAVLGRLEGQPKLFLIDVKSQEEPSYDAGAVATWLEEEGEPRKSILLVSSYAGGPPGRRVEPKSPETLRKVERRLPPRQVLGEIGEGGVIDVLVTGAGFEFRHRHRPRAGGGEPRDVGFGLPPTGDVLLGMGSPFRRTEGGAAPDELVLSPGEAPGDFPWPRIFGSGEEFKDLARNKDLDAWWDLLLETALRPVSRSSHRDQRRSAKRKARESEIKLRDAFRNAILRYDWGHTSQSLRAAQLPWHAWLTTNYTRFADRAIALVGQSWARGDAFGHSAPSWRTISTGNEALLLIQELQEREDDDANGHDQPLFKLHGDISHLQTMAIAGNDKELFNMLSLPVDGLHHVYSAAQKYLLRALEERPGIEMRWHIVGHGLKDATLLSLLVRVARFRGDSEMRFIVVDPDEQSTVADELKRTLEQRLERAPDVSHKPCDAESYLARLVAARR